MHTNKFSTVQKKISSAECTANTKCYMPELSTVSVPERNMKDEE